MRSKLVEVILDVTADVVPYGTKYYEDIKKNPDLKEWIPSDATRTKFGFRKSTRFCKDSEDNIFYLKEKKVSKSVKKNIKNKKGMRLKTDDLQTFSFPPDFTSIERLPSNKKLRKIKFDDDSAFLIVKDRGKKSTE